jgi:hypothetical protein
VFEGLTFNGFSDNHVVQLHERKSAVIYANDTKLPLEAFREFFAYNAETGDFTWKKSPARKAKAGTKAGTKATNGRMYVGLHGEKLLVHRICWFLHYGEWPNLQVSAKDGDYTNLKIDNYKLTTTAELGAMAAYNRQTGASGLKGVCWAKNKSKWVATITRGGKMLTIGYFDDKHEAHEAYMKARSGPLNDSITRYAEIRASQNNLCAICNCEEKTANNRTGSTSLSMDHDHKTGILRALLCQDCNLSLGKMKDDPIRLRAAADYIEFHRARHEAMLKDERNVA